MNFIALSLGRRLSGIRILSISNSFQQGRDGKPFDGGNLSDYQNGQTERANYQNAIGNGGNKTSNGSNPNPPTDGAGANFIGQLILTVILILIAIPSFFATIISGTLILLILIGVLRSFHKDNYQSVYTATYRSTVAYAATGAVLAALQIWIYNDLIIMNEKFTMDGILKYYLVTMDGFHLLPFTALLKFHAISILISAIFLKTKLSHLFKGFAGFLYATALVALVIMPSFVLVLNLFAKLFPEQFGFVQGFFG